MAERRPHGLRCVAGLRLCAASISLAATACAPARPASAPETRVVPSDTLRADVVQRGSKLSIKLDPACDLRSFPSRVAVAPEPRAQVSLPLVAASVPPLVASVPLFAVAPSMSGDARARFIGGGVGSLVAGLIILGFAFVPHGEAKGAALEPDPGDVVQSGVPCGPGAAPARKVKIAVIPPGGQPFVLGETDDRGALEVDLAETLLVQPGPEPLPLTAAGKRIGVVRGWDAGGCEERCRLTCHGADDCMRACRARDCP
jgi:hypothetical protein